MDSIAPLAPSGSSWSASTRISICTSRLLSTSWELASASSRSVPTVDGYAAARGLGQTTSAGSRAFGIEGTGSYGVGLASFLSPPWPPVVRGQRAGAAGGRRHPTGSRTRSTLKRPLARCSPARPPRPRSLAPRCIETIRQIQIARDTRQGSNAGRPLIRSLIVTRPPELNAALAGLSVKRQVASCAQLRPGPARALNDRLVVSCAVSPAAGNSLDQRGRRARARTSRPHQDRGSAPLAEPGIGPDTAGKLLVFASGNAERFRSEPLAKLCGVSPIEASSGKTRRHRLNKGGHRQGNNAL